MSTDSLGEDLRVGDPGSHSAVLSEVHTCQEFIKVADLELSARLVEALIEQA